MLTDCVENEAMPFCPKSREAIRKAKRTAEPKATERSGAFLPEEPRGDSQGKTDSGAEGDGAKRCLFARRVERRFAWQNEGSDVGKYLFRYWGYKGKGIDMLSKINRATRKIILIVGAIFLVFKLTEDKETDKRSEQEGFQTEEFDDIW